VRACMDAGLVRGEGFAVDASVIEANASRYHGNAPGEIDWSVPERQTHSDILHSPFAVLHNATANAKLPR
jgi:hypothetical protein